MDLSCLLFSIIKRGVNKRVGQVYGRLREANKESCFDMNFSNVFHTKSMIHFNHLIGVSGFLQELEEFNFFESGWSTVFNCQFLFKW